MAGELSIENGFPVGAEGFDEDVLNWLGVLVMSVELAAALSLAEVDPVGGTIAGALEARGFAEGLEQHGADAIALLPVLGQLALEAGEQMRCQTGEANPGQDEIAGVIDDQRQVQTSRYRAHRV